MRGRMSRSVQCVYPISEEGNDPYSNSQGTDYLIRRRWPSAQLALLFAFMARDEREETRPSVLPFPVPALLPAECYVVCFNAPFDATGYTLRFGTLGMAVGMQHTSSRAIEIQFTLFEIIRIHFTGEGWPGSMHT